MISAIGISTLQRCEAGAAGFEGFRELTGGNSFSRDSGSELSPRKFHKKIRRQDSAAEMFSSVQDQLTCKRCLDYPSPDRGKPDAAVVTVLGWLVSQWWRLLPLRRESLQEQPAALQPHWSRERPQKHRSYARESANRM
jgi:hypothetical protein